MLTVTRRERQRVGAVRERSDDWRAVSGSSPPLGPDVLVPGSPDRVATPGVRVDAHCPGAIGENLFHLGAQRRQLHVPILLGLCDPLGGSGQQWAQGVEPPFWI